MMWNWLVSSLSLGASLVLYDGSPFYPNTGILWKLAEDGGITIFGTSARYIAAIEKEGLRPGRDYDLNKLRTVLSTGSPLAVEGFYYVYRDIKEDVQLSSISGGTDIIGCFVLGNPIGPVYATELRCRGLGMRVEAFDENGKSVINQRGELVCTAPFPSMPIYFWNDLIVVGQGWENDERIILFVKLAEGAELTDDLKNRIRKDIRENASPRHVPQG